MCACEPGWTCPNCQDTPQDDLREDELPPLPWFPEHDAA